MKTEKKVLSVKIQAEVHAKLQAIQEETGLSQAKVIEMLVNGFSSDEIVHEQVQAQVQVDEEKILAKLQVQVQALVKEQVAIQLSDLHAQPEPEPEPEVKLAPKPKPKRRELTEAEKAYIREGGEIFFEDDDEGYPTPEEEAEALRRWEEENGIVDEEPYTPPIPVKKYEFFDPEEANKHLDPNDPIEKMLREAEKQGMEW